MTRDLTRYFAWCLATAGCAGGGIDTRFPAGSPASTSAPEAPPAVVTSALDADPPLPGDIRALDAGPAPGHGGHHGR